MAAATLSIVNPATGSVMLRVTADGPRDVAQRYATARAAQPRWAATPIRKRIATIEKFREHVVARTEMLAHTLTQEVGKPIRQSRNELKGLVARLDFFIAESARALREQRIFVDKAQRLDERITHEPLGVVANISAWNYPYFVGSNVFVPALAAGNAVLYKPSEFATLTGRHIADLLHASGVPEEVFVPVIGGSATGAALLRQPVDGVFFTGSYGTGATIAASAGKRMIKVQLELGGKDPVYVCDDVDAKVAAAAIADGA
ncbi:MAG: aldehyde dehydrogenase family protein, partial [Pseudomonadota bacterium]|nr:aldehyde dehydrogenase family protein [Pseudomonadota bacterium]